MGILKWRPEKKTLRLGGEGWKELSAGVYYKGGLDSEDLQSGLGICATGDFIIEGDWVDGFLNGEGRFVHSDGTIYIGQFV